MRRQNTVWVVAAGTGLMIGGGSVVAQSPSSHPLLTLPVACEIGRTCWIEHYVDREPAPGVRDYHCGSMTYAGHNGTDIRIADMAAQRAGVNVLAAADGRVLRLRDGEPDTSVRVRGLDAVKNKECGNGVVVDHGGGWQTQYCHMAKGSLVVRPGDVIKAGQPLGHIGLSGETEFPHLHFSVWHDGVTIDPFAPAPGASAVCDARGSLWKQTPTYTLRTVINTGFTSGPLKPLEVEEGGVAPPSGASPYLVAYARILGVKAGDQPSLSLLGPHGEVLAVTPAATVPQDRVQDFVFVGKRRPVAGWPAGPYQAVYTIRSSGKVVLERRFDVSLN